MGKRRSDDGNVETARLDLADHSIDVAAVFEALVAVPLVRRRLEQLAGREITDAAIARLSVLVFLHDIGKTSAGFQSKALPDECRLSWLTEHGFHPGQCGHTRVVAGLLFNRATRQRMSEVFPLELMLGWGSAVLDLLLASISHHGEPLTCRDLSGSSAARWTALWVPADGYNPMAAVATLGASAQAWFPAAWSNAPDSLLPSEPAAVHYFAGLVSLADWIASNDSDEFFPYHSIGHADRAAFSRTRARSVIQRMKLSVEDAREALRTNPPAFGDVFRDEDRPFVPTALQQSMEDPSLGPVVIVESDTGSGKTEAALWRFKTLFEAGEVDGLAFLLPTRVAAVSLEKRVRSCLRALFPDAGRRPNVVLAVPGYIQSDGERGTPLPRFETLWPDSDLDAAAHRRWAAEHPKRFLAAAVAVGTVDQALLSGLTVRHAHLRGAALLRTLIVVDEVHASDAYMTQLLVGLLDRHTDAGGHGLLLSATLGSEARGRLLGSPQRRLRPNEKRDSSPSGSLADVPYPAISDRHAIRPVPARDNAARTVRVRLCPCIDAPERIAAMAAEAARAGAKILVIRNTVAGAVAVQKALEQELGASHPALFRVRDVAAPHHGRFAARDRRVLDEAVERHFGKQASRNGATVLVGTQTLEQSLDIDADYLLTDLAPADILLQRLGRLHRHARSGRPAGFASPEVVILTPASRDLSGFLPHRRSTRRHGIGGRVYENLLSIEATWRELERRSELDLPAENRTIVEAATFGPALDALAGELGPEWERHRVDYIGSQGAMRGAAHINRLDWNLPWDEQAAWPEPGEKLRTRLGLDDRLATLAERWTSPFGQTLAEMKIPGWMADGAEPSDEPAALVEATAGALRFRWAGRDFRIRPARPVAVGRRLASMTDRRFNVVVEPLIRVTLTGGARAKMTLPQVCAALVADRIETFPALRPHQAPAWHAFLVQISAMGLEALGTTELPGEDEGDWARLLRSLTPDWPDDEPWCLVSPAISPALLQAPVPEADVDRYDKIFGKTVKAADALDMLATAKNHDQKSARMHAAEPDDWLFSLVSLQTQEGSMGRGNYGIARMNKGYGNRSYVALRPSSASTPGAAFHHDLRALSSGANALWNDAQPIGFATDEALALLWTLPWDGEDSLPISRLHPLFVEICRRVRLEFRNGILAARAANSMATRVEAKEHKGNLADPWTPVERSDEAKALSLTAEGFSYQKMSELLFGTAKRSWHLPLLAKVRGSSPAARFVAEGIARGQGKTEGFHRRSVPVPDAAVRLLDENPDMLSGRARERVRAAATVQNKCLYPALVVLVQKGPEQAAWDKPSNGSLTAPWTRRFDSAVDRIFFTALWESLDLDDESAALSWARALADLARGTLDAASEAAPRADERRIMASARARNLLEGAIRKRFPDIFPPSQGAPAHDRS